MKKRSSGQTAPRWKKQATMPIIFLRKPKSLCGCWTTQVLGSVRREGRKLGGLIPERNFLCLQGEVLEPTAMMCLNTRKWRFMSVIQQQQNARELFHKRKRNDEDRKILFHRAALFKRREERGRGQLTLKWPVNPELRTHYLSSDSYVCVASRH